MELKSPCFSVPQDRKAPAGRKQREKIQGGSKLGFENKDF